MNDDLAARADRLFRAGRRQLERNRCEWFEMVRHGDRRTLRAFCEMDDVGRAGAGEGGVCGRGAASGADGAAPFATFDAFGFLAAGIGPIK